MAQCMCYSRTQLLASVIAPYEVLARVQHAAKRSRDAARAAAHATRVAAEEAEDAARVARANSSVQVLFDG